MEEKRYKYFDKDGKALDNPEQNRILRDGDPNDTRASNQHPKNITEARLGIVARELSAGTQPAVIAEILGVSKSYVSTLMKTVKRNGMFAAIQDKLNDKMVELVQVNTKASINAVKLWERRLKEAEEEAKISPEALADSFKIAEMSNSMTGVKEKHQAVNNNGGGNSQGVNVNIASVIGKEDLDRAKEAMRRTTQE